MMKVNRLTDCLTEFQQALYEKTVPVKGEQFAHRHKPKQEFVPGYPNRYTETGITILTETALLRSKLILEETRELVGALLSEDKEQVTKELCDLLYVAIAVAVLYDLPLEPAFNRVHANNMAKIKNGTIAEDGKLEKTADHPKVVLKDLFHENA